jgi:hypothetical protein
LSVPVMKYIKTTVCKNYSFPRGFKFHQLAGKRNGIFYF